MKKKKILIVDDDLAASKFMKARLEITGKYEVSTESNGVRGIETARGLRPDLIILDILMPGIEGDEVARQIKADNILKNTPIIFLSSIITSKETGPDGMKTGAHYILPKPVKIESVLACIEKHFPPN